MRLQESIRRVLREETSNPVNLILRRLDTLDWLVEFSAREIQRQYGNICNLRTPENYVEVIIEKTGDGIYWDHFADTIEDDSEEWGIMYKFIEEYVKNKFGDYLKTNFKRMCKRLNR